jgi:hypothetical protein
MPNRLALAGSIRFHGGNDQSQFEVAEGNPRVPVSGVKGGIRNSAVVDDDHSAVIAKKARRDPQRDRELDRDPCAGSAI